MRFSLTVPETQPLGDVDTAARVSYVFEGALVEVSEPFTVEVVSAVSASVSATPSPVRPGRSVEATTTLRNAGRDARHRHAAGRRALPGGRRRPRNR